MCIGGYVHAGREAAFTKDGVTFWGVGDLDELDGQINLIIASSPLWIIADPPWHIDAVGGRSHHHSLAVDKKPVNGHYLSGPTNTSHSRQCRKSSLVLPPFVKNAAPAIPSLTVILSVGMQAPKTATFYISAAWDIRGVPQDCHKST